MMRGKQYQTGKRKMERVEDGWREKEGARADEGKGEQREML